jgi:hypothetical protein
MVMKAGMAGEANPVNSADLERDDWVELRRMYVDAQRARGSSRLLYCLDCGHTLYPREHWRTGSPHFAHNPGSPEWCELHGGGESAEHDRLKTAIYRSIKRVKGFDADMEVETPNVDKITGRPGRVDVVALPVTAGAGELNGWEVQLSPMSEGRALSRQEHREAWLTRCSWVTKSKPRWASTLPWYRVEKPTERSADLVVEGVQREIRADWEVSYEPVDAFPASQMVRYILKRRVDWNDVTGWLLAATRTPSSTGKKKSTAKGRAAAWCDRELGLPDFVLRWTEEEWQHWALGAHARLLAGERLQHLDEAAIARYPVGDGLDEDLEPLVFDDYDTLVDIRPCTICLDLVVSSASSAFPIHHHCAWHVGRGDVCSAPGLALSH